MDLYLLDKRVIIEVKRQRRLSKVLYERGTGSGRNESAHEQVCRYVDERRQWRFYSDGGMGRREWIGAVTDGHAWGLAVAGKPATGRRAGGVRWLGRHRAVALQRGGSCPHHKAGVLAGDAQDAPARSVHGHACGWTWARPPSRLIALGGAPNAGCAHLGRWFARATTT